MKKGVTKIFMMLLVVFPLLTNMMCMEIIPEYLTMTLENRSNDTVVFLFSPINIDTSYIDGKPPYRYRVVCPPSSSRIVKSEPFYKKFGYKPFYLCVYDYSTFLDILSNPSESEHLGLECYTVKPEWLDAHGMIITYPKN